MELPTLRITTTEELIMRTAGALGDAAFTKRIQSVVDTARFVHGKCHTDLGEYRGFLIGLYHVLQVLSERRPTVRGGK